MVKQIFINLPVKDLNRSIEFFKKLGFSFDPDFTDENATCMIVGENIFAMLLVEKFFRTFIEKEICDATRSTEAILALSLDRREAVDAMVRAAEGAGGSIPRKAIDHGWMYQWGFQDPDGHLWEPFWIDPKAKP